MPTPIQTKVPPVCTRCGEVLTYSDQADHDKLFDAAERILEMIEGANPIDWLIGTCIRKTYNEEESEFLPVAGFGRVTTKQHCGFQLDYSIGGFWPRCDKVEKISVDETLQRGMIPWRSIMNVYKSDELQKELNINVVSALMRLPPKDLRNLLLGRPIPEDKFADAHVYETKTMHPQQFWKRQGSMPVPLWTDQDGGYLHLPLYNALDRLEEDRKLESCLPKKELIFRAFDLVGPKDVRVVILGQDPYPDENDAMGLAFSSNSKKIPASLRNIFKEMQSDISACPSSADLTYLAYQGVLLANTSLTLGAQGEPHHDYWYEFTSKWITALAANRSIVWILWGKKAQEYNYLIESTSQKFNRKNIILESAHPSPLSVRHGFYGSRPFSKANEALVSLGLEPINWIGNETTSIS